MFSSVQQSNIAQCSVQVETFDLIFVLHDSRVGERAVSHGQPSSKNCKDCKSCKSCKQ